MTYPHWEDDAHAAWHQQSMFEQQQIEATERKTKMKARQKSGGGDFQPLDVGVYPAVCHMLVDIGLQQSNNPKFKDAYKLILGFQIPGERRDDGGPQVLTMTLTASMNKKANLRKFVENWFGKAFPSDETAEDFDLKNLLGKGCFLNVTHNEKGERVYANIASIVPLPKGVEKPEVEGEVIYYSEDGDMDAAARGKAYASLPEWIQKKVDAQLRVDPGAGTAAGSSAPAGDDDIPF